MPGRIEMEQQGAVGSLDLKKDRSHAQIAQPAPVVQSQSAQQTNGHGQANGQNGALSNGISHGDATTATNGAPNHPDTATTDITNPPPLDGSWREQQTNKSFGKLVARLSQQCFVDLNHTLTEMSEVQEEAQRPQINGALQPAQDTSEASLKKKRILMEFAKNQRDRFVRALVLSDASRNQEDQARLIDVKVWQDKQFEAYAAAKYNVGLAKLKMIDVKQASPNIEDAMEILSIGKATRMPHLGYIPPKKASAKELLNTLRDMNVIIATRLNLHDELSPHMKDYTIADGRVMFKVSGEFEVDLSVGDDDPESQFFFLDLRLAFKPSTGTISDALRGHLEARVNHALMEKGLPGCYEFLHNFVLTHKVNVLRSQVVELTQSKWFGCIRAENLRRSLAVQYWSGRPGSKSWIEIGIVTGKSSLRSRRPQTSCLSVRWFRRGVEVKDEALDFDWSDLSLERCLSVVIQKHTSWVLEDVQKRIKDLAPASFCADCQAGETGAQKVLVSSLPCHNAPLQVRIEAVTGQYSLSPPSGPTARAERHLNNDSTADLTQWLANTLCAVAQEHIHKAAELLQWAPVRDLARQDNLKKIFGDGLRAHSTFVPRTAWGQQWALAVTFSLAGEVWWAVSLEVRRDDQGNPAGNIIGSARRLRQISRHTGSDTGSHAALLRIERAAVAEVAYGALSRQFNEMKVEHRFKEMTRSVPGETAEGQDSESSPVALFFAVAQLLKVHKHGHAQTWADNVARLTHHGMVENGPDGTGIRHDLRIALAKGKTKQLQKHLTNFEDRNLVLSEDGGVALRILAPFGKPFADQIKSRLQHIERLDHHVRALQKLGLPCTHVSLFRLSFTYSKDPELSATLLFPSEDGLPIRFKLNPTDINPHTRTKILLENGLNETGARGVEAVAFITLLTLSLLRAFERVEARSTTRHSVSVQCRSSTRYLLKYTSPLPTCAFEIRARLRKEGAKRVPYWTVQLKGNGARLPDGMAQALTQEVWQGRGEHWSGKGVAVVAAAAGIESVLERVDAAVRRFENAVASQSDGASGASAAQQPAQEQAKPQAQAPGPAQSGGRPQTPNSKQSQGQQQQRQKAANGVKKQQPDVIMLD